MKIIWKISLPLGCLIFAGSNLYAHYFSITDFLKGFFEGMSAALIVVGFIYLIFYIIKKKNRNN